MVGAVKRTAVVMESNGRVVEDLFTWRDTITDLVPDRSGHHLLMVSQSERRPGFFVEDLYRWSRSDRRPTKIRGGVVAAAWIPR